MTSDEIGYKVSAARKHLLYFTDVTYAKFTRTTAHDYYYGVLNAFAEGKIPKLIVTMPPQHGKTEGSSRRLPAYMFGQNPDLKIAIASYSQTFARKIGREVRRICADKKYQYIFPETKMADFADKGYINTADEAEIVGGNGSLILAGRGAGLTGSPVDVLIMDDLYKNSMEANSPIIRESVIDWYKTVADTRLHNDSQQLIVFTRWHQEDLVGWLEGQGLVKELESVDDIDPDYWYRINFPAIKVGQPTQLDPRKAGAALWPGRHSLRRLKKKQEQDQEVFDSLYQGNPVPSKGLLYAGGFECYDYLPEKITDRWGYTDTADEGSDYLGSIAAITDGEYIYVTDVFYSQEGQEYTEPMTAKLIIDNNVDDMHIESNAGGRAFARNVEKELAGTKHKRAVHWFHQSKNKEARIITNASAVRKSVKFPRGWESRWPEFARDLKNFKKNFRANTHDDAPDTLTGLYEKSILNGKSSARVADFSASAIGV